MGRLLELLKAHEGRSTPTSDADHIRRIEDMVDATPDPRPPYIGRYPVPKNFDHFKPLTLEQAIKAIKGEWP